MISMKFNKARSVFLLKNFTSFSTASEHNKATPAKHDDHHDAHHGDQPAFQPYEGEIVQKSNIFPNQDNEHTSRSLYSVFGKLSQNKTIFSFFFNNMTHAKTQEVSEYFNPPKIHENGVFIYQSKKLGNSIRFTRGSEFLIIGYMSLFCPHPLYFAVVGSIFYCLWFNAFFHEMSRRLVVRMDLLPHLEMINMQKIGAFGNIYNKLVRIQDLEKVPYEDLKDKENYFWFFNHYVLDRGMIFRDKSTGEVFCFDPKGVWDEEGLNHKLIN